MFKTPLNQRTVTLKLKRRDVVDLLIACAECGAAEEGSKWALLHDAIKQQLTNFDEKQEDKE